MTPNSAWEVGHLLLSEYNEILSILLSSFRTWGFDYQQNKLSAGKFYCVASRNKQKRADKKRKTCPRNICHATVGYKAGKCQQYHVYGLTNCDNASSKPKEILVQRQVDEVCANLLYTDKALPCYCTKYTSKVITIQLANIKEDNASVSFYTGFPDYDILLICKSYEAVSRWRIKGDLP